MNALLHTSIALLLPLPLTLPAQSSGANDDRKVRIEITTTEDGHTTRVEREFDLSDERSLQDALRELGVLEELGTIGADENLIIDLRRLRDGGALKDMSLAFAMQDEASDHTPHGYLGAYLGLYNTPKEGKGRKDADLTGIVLTQVIEDGPAHKAGLKDGDVVVAIDGGPVGSLGAFTERIQGHKPGEVATLTIVRDGKRLECPVTLGERPGGPEDLDLDLDLDDSFSFTFPDAMDMPMMTFQMGPRAYLGVNGADGRETSGEGAHIGSVVDSSAAQRMGLKAGDRIVALNGGAISDFGDLAERIGKMKPGDTAQVEVLRNGTRETLTGTLGEHAPHTWAMPPMAHMAPLEPYPGEDRAEIRREMEQLRREMEELRRTMRSDIRREMHVEVAAVDVTPQERELLRGKGVHGLDDSPALGDLRCFPNPNNGFFRLQFDVADRGDLGVDVHDARGERVYHEVISGFKGRYERTLDLSDQGDGTYYLVITRGDKALARKLIKQ